MEARGTSDFVLDHSIAQIYVGGKVLYIYDDEIVGNDQNESTGTGTSGIAYKNNNFILRYIIGV